MTKRLCVMSKSKHVIVLILNAHLPVYPVLSLQYGEEEDEDDEDGDGAMAEGEESNEGSGDANEPFEGDDTEVPTALCSEFIILFVVFECHFVFLYFSFLAKFICFI